MEDLIQIIIIIAVVSVFYVFIFCLIKIGGDSDKDIKKMIDKYIREKNGQRKPCKKNRS